MRRQHVLLDIQTQRDFFVAGGAAWTRQSSAAAARVYDLFRLARRRRWPVISTLLRVRRGDVGPMGDFPHCVDGSDGERKLSRTILPNHIDLGMRKTTDLPVGILDRYDQVLFESRGTDIFTHPRLERLITHMSDTTFIICGAGLAHGVAEAAIGLRCRGLGVIVASDAVLDVGRLNGDMARRRMEAKGAVFAPTASIVAAFGVERPRWRGRRVAVEHADLDEVRLAVLRAEAS